MNAQHTPGPWAAAGHIVYAGPSFRVATVQAVGAVACADARLIAAAPDLLSAALVLLRAADEGDSDMAMDGYDKLRAAVAHAEGGTI